MTVNIEDLALVASGWALLDGEQQKVLAAELLELRVAALQSEHGTCTAPDCVLWAHHDVEGWCHVDDLAQMEQDG